MSTETTTATFLGTAKLDPTNVLVPLAGARAALGFPSPAEDFLDDTIDLNEWLIRNPAATFYYRASGWSMLQDGICDGDILIVDRSVTPIDGDLLNLPMPKGRGSKNDSIGVSRLSSCDYSIRAMTDGKFSFANDPL